MDKAATKVSPVAASTRNRYIDTGRPQGTPLPVLNAPCPLNVRNASAMPSVSASPITEKRRMRSMGVCAAPGEKTA